MTARLAEVRLEPAGSAPLSPELEQEQRVAIFDLIEENSFALPEPGSGPYALALGVAGSHISFALSGADGAGVADFMLSLGPLRQILKDYSDICASYYAAVRDSAPAEIEALDEARRAIHAEGAQTLRDLLDGKAEIDAETAKRLFTLVFTLTRPAAA